MGTAKFNIDLASSKERASSVGGFGLSIGTSSDGLVVVCCLGTKGDMRRPWGSSWWSHWHGEGESGVPALHMARCLFVGFSFFAAYSVGG